MRRLVVLCTVVLALVAPAGASASEFGRGADVVRSAQTGAVRFAAPASPLPTTGPPGPAGRAFLRAHADAFGLRGASTLRPAGRAALSGGTTAVRYAQAIGGVPVVGGELVVRFASDGDILSAGGETEPDADVDLVPALSAGVARRLATDAVADAEGVPVGRLLATLPELEIFDARLVGVPGPAAPVLAWAVEVSAPGYAISRLELLDADSGAHLATFDRIHDAKQRSVCNAANDIAHPQVPCTNPVLTEGGSTSDPEIKAAYDYAGATYDFYSGRFGRDSLDNHGMALRSTVRYCEPESPCPYDNAFWDGNVRQMVYGEWYARADDVVAHELTHGVTEYTADLEYVGQSGAINESMSDVFGELIDRVTASPDDGAGLAWLIGESLPGGAIRDMADPPVFGQPETVGGTWWYEGSTDYGGVHINSGVGNKAAFLITSGGSLGGVTVSPGLGIDKAARLYYDVLAGYLTPGSDYADLGTTLVVACEQLTRTSGFTATDCASVHDAAVATRMLAADTVALETQTLQEGAGTATLQITRTGDTGTASVRVRTTTGGTAQSVSDFRPVDAVASFSAGSRSASVPITLVDDARVEGPETIAVLLSNPVDMTIVGTGKSLVTIVDDDAPVPAPTPTPTPPPVATPTPTPTPAPSPVVTATPAPSGPASTPRRRLRVVHASSAGRRVTLRIEAPAAGTIVVDGRARGTRLKRRTAETVEAERVTVKAAIPRTLRRPVTVTFRVTFKPDAGGRTRTLTKKVRLTVTS